MAKILIAEDEKDIRDLIAFTLRFAGHEVELTSDGAEALATARTTLPDLIMLDVRMPKMTGYDACRAIKADESLSATPVVFVSAKGQESEVEEGYGVGAIRYILKPFTPDALVQTVNELLEIPAPKDSNPNLENAENESEMDERSDD